MNKNLLLIKEYDDIPQEAISIREDVFVREQGFQDEFDERDHHCMHIVVFDCHEPVATCRYFYEEGHYVLGRIAVIHSYRHLGIGTMMIQYIINHICDCDIVLHAQLQAVPFYEKLGFQAYGEVEYEEHCPHTWMKKVNNIKKVL